MIFMSKGLILCIYTLSLMQIHHKLTNRPLRQPRRGWILVSHTDSIHLTPFLGPMYISVQLILSQINDAGVITKH